MDRRALHRKLATEQQTFSAIVETVRTEIVTRTLPSRERRLGSIADMTGFASLSAFSRWFHGRYGRQSDDLANTFVPSGRWNLSAVTRGRARRDPSAQTVPISEGMRCRTCEVAPVEPTAKQAHFYGMTHLRFEPFVTVAAMLAAMLLSGCGSTGTPQDGRYRNSRGRSRQLPCRDAGNSRGLTGFVTNSCRYTSRLGIS